jgi:two-component sensor histidine kinase
MRYAFALLAVLAVGAFRTAFDAALAPGAYYYLYLPVVAVLSYVLGLGPALFAVVLGGAFSYYAFSEPAWTIKTDLRANLRVLLFFANGAAIAYLISHIRTRLRGLDRNVEELSSLSKNQAEVFREYAGRVGDHLQLISALLQVKAAQEDGDHARVLTNAASRTMLISRIHRSFLVMDDQRIDFVAFANRLVHAALQARGSPPLVVSIEGELELLPEQGTSLALVLLDWLNGRLAQKPRGAMRITFDQDHNECSLTMAEEGISRESLRQRSMAVVGAISEQMRGQLVLGGARDRGMLRFVFPRELQALPNWDPLEPVH